MPEETPELVLDDVGRRISEIRRAGHLTQREVADRLGMLIGDYQAIERGTRNCTVRTLVHVARALGVPTRALFEAPASRPQRRRGRPRKARADAPHVLAVESPSREDGRKKK